MFKILIAEDDRELRQLFAHVLTKNGYTVLGVSNGEEALTALDQTYFDLIISDIMMPKMDGYEATQKIREISPDVPVMAITAFAYAEDEQHILNSGFNAYTSKPIQAFAKKTFFIPVLSRSHLNNTVHPNYLPVISRITTEAQKHPKRGGI